MRSPSKHPQELPTIKPNLPPPPSPDKPINKPDPEPPTPRPEKPLGRKAYGTIGHLYGSNLGKGDRRIPMGQDAICQVKRRPGDTIVIMEKLDGTNCAVAKVDGEIIPLIRAGYRAIDSPYVVHHMFHWWVKEQEAKGAFRRLPEGWRICGEWMPMAHGTLYAWQGSLFVCFDVFNEKNQRLLWERKDDGLDAKTVIEACWQRPAQTIPCQGRPMEAWDAYQSLLPCGFYNAIDPPEGLVYRVEREGKVDFLAKWVHGDFVPGKYLESVTEGHSIWQWLPEWEGV